MTGEQPQVWIEIVVHADPLYRRLVTALDRLRDCVRHGLVVEIRFDHLNGAVQARKELRLCLLLEHGAVSVRRLLDEGILAGGRRAKDRRHRRPRKQRIRCRDERRHRKHLQLRIVVQVDDSLHEVGERQLLRLRCCAGRLGGALLVLVVLVALVPATRLALAGLPGAAGCERLLPAVQRALSRRRDRLRLAAEISAVLRVPHARSQHLLLLLGVGGVRGMHRSGVVRVRIAGQRALLAVWALVAPFHRLAVHRGKLQSTALARADGTSEH